MSDADSNRIADMNQNIDHMDPNRQMRDRIAAGRHQAAGFPGGAGTGDAIQPRHEWPAPGNPAADLYTGRVPSLMDLHDGLDSLERTVMGLQNGLNDQQSLIRQAFRKIDDAVTRLDVLSALAKTQGAILARQDRRMDVLDDTLLGHGGRIGELIRDQEELAEEEELAANLSMRWSEDAAPADIRSSVGLGVFSAFLLCALLLTTGAILHALYVGVWVP